MQLIEKTRPFHSNRAQARGTASPQTRVPADLQREQSNARMAAEAAFSAPARDAVPDAQPLVIVRRPRIVLSPPADAAPAETTPQAEAGGKAARVFLVGKSRDPAADADGTASAQMPTAANGEPGGVKRRTGRSRRLAPDRRPGPVVIALRAPQTEATGKGSAAGAATKPQLEALMGQLASVDPILESIRHAQALDLTASPEADEWQGLARAVDTLRQEIAALVD